jgi:myo-inositol-1(or 4)-monophosphatase
MKWDDRYLQLAMAAAKEAGRIQMLHFGHSHPVQYKEKFNPVTEVDRLCDRVIGEMISKVFPDHDILTEESPFQGKGSPWKWIIDPMDGTTNYFHGFPCFCVSIALEVEGETKLGVVYDPIRNELFHAEKGKGVFLNRHPIRVSRTEHLKKGFLSTGFPYDAWSTAQNNLDNYNRFAKMTQGVRRLGSAALDACYVAQAASTRCSSSMSPARKSGSISSAS